MDIREKIKQLLFVRPRIWKYRFLSDCKNVTGSPVVHFPLLLKGNGRISFGKNVQIGVIASPDYYSHYTYLESRNHDTLIAIGSNVSINNGFSASAMVGISIGDNVLIGTNCSIIDTDAHPLPPGLRHTGEPTSHPVKISDNVFLGDNVMILKGVTIGKDSVIGAGSVVVSDIPESSVAVGNPARVIRNL